MHEVTLHYTERIMRKAVRGYFVRAFLRRRQILFIVAALLLGVSIWLSLEEKDYSWRLGSAAATLLFLVSLPLFIYQAHHRNTLGRFRQLKTPSATLTLGEEQWTITSELGSSTLPWSAITEVWRFPEVWLLMLSPAQFITVPVASLDEEAKEIIKRKLGK